MTDFKAIKGFNVKSLATDPLKPGTANGTWSSGGTMNQARNALYAFGTQSAQMIAAGHIGPPTNVSEIYDGSSWTNAPTINTARNNEAGAGSGTTTAGLIYGGNLSPGRAAITELYNGTAWSELNDLNTGRYALSGVGTSTASLAFAGNAATGNVAINESWNGTSWTELNDLNTARSGGSGLGATSTAALQVGGATVNTESWNGTSWTEVNNLNVVHSDGFARGGTQTSGLIAGGSNPGGFLALTEFWDGTSWTEIADLATANKANNGQGTSTATISCGGIGSPDSTVNTAEEFTAAGIADTIVNEGQVYYNSTAGTMNVTAVVFGTATWSSGGNLNTARGSSGGAGLQTSGLIFGGYNADATAAVAITEAYNGSSWTEVADLNTVRNNFGAQAGTQTAALAAGGSGGAKTDIWDGSSWTEVNDMNAVQQLSGSFGISTSAVTGGGISGSPRSTVSQVWDGTNWAENTATNTCLLYTSPSPRDS